jgi:hypothetical protein
VEIPAFRKGLTGRGDIDAPAEVLTTESTAPVQGESGDGGPSLILTLF